MVQTAVFPEVPNLADLLQREAATEAWLKAHGSADGDARCKGCQVEYLKAELSADGLCRHCADELGQMHPLNTQIADKLRLDALVAVERLGILGVVSGRSTCDGSRYRVSWFDRHFWQIRHRWFEKEVLTVIEPQNQTAAARLSESRHFRQQRGVARTVSTPPQQEKL